MTTADTFRLLLNCARTRREGVAALASAQRMSCAVEILRGVVVVLEFRDGSRLNLDQNGRYQAH